MLPVSVLAGGETPRGWPEPEGVRGCEAIGLAVRWGEKLSSGETAGEAPKVRNPPGWWKYGLGSFGCSEWCCVPLCEWW